MGFDFLVFFDGRDVVDIDGFALVLTHEAYGILDMTEAALAEHIVFVKAEVLGVIHIEVGDWESFGHHL